MRDANMNWVCLCVWGYVNQIWKLFIVSEFSPLLLVFGFAATRLQAKYKGYKAKGEFRKQKEAGKHHRT